MENEAGGIQTVEPSQVEQMLLHKWRDIINETWMRKSTSYTLANEVKVLFCLLQLFYLIILYKKASHIYCAADQSGLSVCIS